MASKESQNQEGDLVDSIQESHKETIYKLY
jgi:hypothetical protein